MVPGVALQHPLSEAAVRRRPLLIGPAGDLDLVDVTSLGAAEAAQVVARGSRAGAHVAVVGTSTENASAVSAAGALVIVTADDAGRAVDQARALEAAGVRVGSLVAEVPLASIDAVAAAGYAVGVDLGQVPAAPGSQESTSEDALAGWQIGALTVAVRLPVRTVRGISPRRFRRVMAVVDSIHGAVSGTGGP